MSAEILLCELRLFCPFKLFISDNKNEYLFNCVLDVLAQVLEKQPTNACSIWRQTSFRADQHVLKSFKRSDDRSGHRVAYPLVHLYFTPGQDKLLLEFL